MNQSAKILVVDDDASGRYVKSHLLARHGYDTIEVDSGAQALAMVALECPALVILDVRLRDMSGLDVCREIKTRFAHCLVLQTSAAVTSGSERAHALDVGADGYMIEPFEATELLALVRALLRTHRAEHALRRMNEDLELIVAERTRALEKANLELAGEIEEHRKTGMILWHAQKLDLISRFTGGVAHDFNNLLTIIAGNLSLLRIGLNDQTTPPSERMLRMLSTAQDAAANGGQITQRLLAFARHAPGEAVLTQIHDLATTWEPLFKQAVGEAIALDLRCDPALWTCVVDHSQLEAAIINLVVNAKDAIKNGGSVAIAITNRALNAESAQTFEAPPGDYVQITVSDDGIGMSRETLDHIYEPFFTTKPVGQGSGLGLSQVYGFVRQSGGHIDVSSTPGIGTTFTLLLPRVEGIPAAARAPLVGEDEGGTETILVVDDNPEVRNVTSELVSGLGYQVVCAANGSDALKILEDQSGVDMIVTDVVMPGGIDGFELARRAHSMRPALPVLMTSGYTSQWADKSNPQNLTVLRKPYGSGDLARHIRMALDNRA